MSTNPFEEECHNPFEQGEEPCDDTEVTSYHICDMESRTEHKFQWHNYKRPTFCAHCKNLLVGLAKQGMRCKRCEIDVHDKCQEDLEKSCIELIVGHHNFRERTYKQPTYCDFCKKLLVGLMNQGLKCSECGSNVHEKCQEKIETKCSQTLTRKKETIQRGKQTRSSMRSKNGKSSAHSTTSSTQESESAGDSSSLFATMPSKGRRETMTPTDSPMGTPRGSRSSSVAGPAAGASGKKQQQQQQQGGGDGVQQVNQMVDDVVQIMKTNAEKLNERGQKIEKLEGNALQLEEKASLFEKKAKDLKKKMWWKNYKMMIALAVALVLLIAIIVVAVVFSSKKKK